MTELWAEHLVGICSVTNLRWHVSSWFPACIFLSLTHRRQQTHREAQTHARKHQNNGRIMRLVVRLRYGSHSFQWQFLTQLTKWFYTHKNRFYRIRETFTSCFLWVKYCCMQHSLDCIHLTYCTTRDWSGLTYRTQWEEDVNIRKRMRTNRTPVTPGTEENQPIREQRQSQFKHARHLHDLIIKGRRLLTMVFAQNLIKKMETV